MKLAVVSILLQSAPEDYPPTSYKAPEDYPPGLEQASRGLSSYKLMSYFTL